MDVPLYQQTAELESRQRFRYWITGLAACALIILIGWFCVWVTIEIQSYFLLQEYMQYLMHSPTTRPGG